MDAHLKLCSLGCISIASFTASSACIDNATVQRRKCTTHSCDEITSTSSDVQMLGSNTVGVGVGAWMQL